MPFRKVENSDVLLKLPLANIRVLELVTAECFKILQFYVSSYNIVRPIQYRWDGSFSCVHFILRAGMLLIIYL